MNFVDLIEVCAGLAHGNFPVPLGATLSRRPGPEWVTPRFPSSGAPSDTPRGIGLTARALALYHDFDDPHVPRESRYLLPLLCAGWCAGVANLDFANASNPAHRQTLTVGFLFVSGKLRRSGRH